MRPTNLEETRESALETPKNKQKVEQEYLNNLVSAATQCEAEAKLMVMINNFVNEKSEMNDQLEKSGKQLYIFLQQKTFIRMQLSA